MTSISTDIGRPDDHRSTWLIHARETVGRRVQKGHSVLHSAQFGGVSNRPNTLCQRPCPQRACQGFDIAGEKAASRPRFWDHRIPS